MDVTGARSAWFLLTQHWLSLIGSALIATALISWLFVLPLQIRGHASSPYAGIIVFLALPALFFAGLALVPNGVYLSKRQIREGLSRCRIAAGDWGALAVANFSVKIVCVSHMKSATAGGHVDYLTSYNDAADLTSPRSWAIMSR